MKLNLALMAASLVIALALRWWDGHRERAQANREPALDRAAIMKEFYERKD